MAFCFCSTALRLLLMYSVGVVTSNSGHPKGNLAHTVDVVDVGKMSLQIIFMCFLTNCGRAPLKFARFNNFRI